VNVSSNIEPLNIREEESETKEPGQQDILRKRRMIDLRREIRKRKRWRSVEFCLYLLGIGALVVANYSFREVLFQEGDIVFVLFANAIAVGAVLGLISNFVKELAGDMDTTHLERELNNLQIDEEVGELLKGEKSPSYFDSLVEINLGNLRRYYDLVRVILVF